MIMERTRLTCTLRQISPFLSSLKYILVISVLSAGVFFLFIPASVRTEEINRIILDTDISSDVDDVGAVAVLHALADQRKAQILGIMVSSGDPWSGNCLDALNTSFGRPDIPIGVIKDPAVTHVSKYTRYIAENYPNDLSKEDILAAVSLYRKILASQPDHSVTVISIGYLSNLDRLLRSGPDAFSPLDGKTLVKKKVKRLVCMGGEFPEGREWNLYQDAAASSFVVARWPVALDFCGFEIGRRILTGQVLQNILTDHPLKKSYQLFNNLTNRQSWDQVAVLQGVIAETSPDKYWEMTSHGVVQVDAKGNNSWRAEKSGLHRYMLWTSRTEQLTHVIDKLMFAAAGRAVKPEPE